MSDSPTPLVFAGGWLDRADALRRDAGAIEALRRSPESRWLLFAGLKPVLRAADGGVDLLWFGQDDLPSLTDWVFLGLDGGLAHFAASVETAPAPGVAIDSRAAAMQLLDARVALLGQARALLAWHDRHGFCAVCGQATTPAKAGYSRKCVASACASEHFPRVDPVVIMLVTDGERCLLGRQPSFPPRFYSALAGFVEPGESLEEAVAREVMEEAGIRVGAVRYLASQPWPFPSSLMIGCMADARSTDIRIDTHELEDARWFSRAEVAAALAGSGPFAAPPAIAIARHLLEHWMC